MAHAASGIGLQNPAFFVGRAELLDWVNGLLNLRLTKVEQVASGAVHCQILDACHPGVVNMSKVNFDAKNEYDMVNNYKQLQIVFDKLKISRNIEVGKLVKARPLDNLEFLQWMKYYYDTATGGVRPADYDGDTRRQQSKGGANVKRSVNAKRSANAGAATTKVVAAKGPDADRAPTATTQRDVRRGGIAAAPAELKALGAANAELKLAVERTEQEREFYFEKLQDIEFLCQRPEFADTALARVVEKILYFTEGKPDVDAIIRECRDAPEGEAAAPVPAAPLTVATVATETIVPAEEEAVATPTFDEAAALGAALENECVDLTAPSSPLASSLCVSKDASTRAPLSPLSPQPTNAS